MDISLEDEAQILPKKSYAIIGVHQDEGGKQFIRLKNSIASYAWYGDKTDSDLWKDCKIVTRTSMTNLIKLNSTSINFENTINDEENKESDQDIESSVLVSMDQFIDDIEQITVSKTNIKNSSEWRHHNL